MLHLSVFSILEIQVETFKKNTFINSSNHNKPNCCCLVPKSWSNSFATPWTEAFQAPLFMGFSRQEHWSGLPFHSPEDLPNTEFKPGSPALAGKFFTTEPPRKSQQTQQMLAKYFFRSSMAQRVKNLPAVQENRFDSWVGKIPKGGNGNPLQSSCLENSTDRGAWRVAKSWTQLSD